MARRSLDPHRDPGAGQAIPGPPPEGAEPPDADLDALGTLARAIVATRARIGDYLDPLLFADPAFDILLELFASEREGRGVNMSDCAGAARIPRTTALRWICLLEEKGLLVRRHDSTDQRVTLVQLSETGRCSIRAYLEQIKRPSST